MSLHHEQAGGQYRTIVGQRDPIVLKHDDEKVELPACRPSKDGKWTSTWRCKALWRRIADDAAR